MPEYNEEIKINGERSDFFGYFREDSEGVNKEKDIEVYLQNYKVMKSFIKYFLVKTS